MNSASASRSLARFRSALAWSVVFIAVALLRADDVRIGIIGLDTSHVGAFLDLLNDPASKDHVAGGKIVGAYRGGSPDLEFSVRHIDEFTQEVVEKYHVKLYDSIERLARDVDAFIIFSVDGRPHLDQFKRTLGSGHPVFIDKPLAGSLKDAVELVRLARETHTPVYSSSSLRYTFDKPVADPVKIGQLTSVVALGPIELEPHHPDLFWYGIHTVEALYTQLGPGCVSVVRTHTDHSDVMTGVWSDGRVGTMIGTIGGYHGYGVRLIGTKGSVFGGEHYSYRPLCESVIKFFQTRVSPVPPETTLEIHAFMEAADESKRRGGAVVTLAEVLQTAGAK